MGIPVGYIIPVGNRDGEIMSPVSLSGDGDGDGEIFTLQGWDGEAEPDGEFPVAIFTWSMASVKKQASFFRKFK
jgi:hypothetical protein